MTTRAAMTARSAITAALLMISAACGSTVDQSTLAATDDVPGDGGRDGLLSDTAATDGGTPTAQSSGDTAAPGDVVTGAARNADPTAGRAAAPRGGASAQTGSPGPGISDDVITVGISYVGNRGAGNEAAGVDVIDYGNPREQWEAMLDVVNSSGGVAGRTLEPVWFEWQEGDSYASVAQRECAAFTEDDQVFAVLSGASDHARSCLLPAGLVAISGGITGGPINSPALAATPGYFIVADPEVDRGLALMVDGLARSGWFGDSPVLGLVSYDEPMHREAVALGLKPALARHGVEIKEEVRVAYPETAESIGQLGAQMSNAVLRFRQSGVTHVLFDDTEGGTQFLFFSQTAEGQAYRPAYGLSSGSSPGAAGAEVFDPDQLAQVTGVGWSPSFDVDAAHADPPPPYEAACLKLYADRGITFSDRTGQAIGMSRCDTVRFFAEAAGRVGGPLNQGSFQASVEAFGTTFESASIWRTRFAPDQRAGGNAYRLFRWDTECPCFVYTTPIASIR